MTDQSSQVTFRRGFVTADFLAHNYRISGEVNVRARPLADSLNDGTTDYLETENVYVSPIQNPADIKASYSSGSLYKNNISMVVLAREEVVVHPVADDERTVFKGRVTIEKGAFLVDIEANPGADF